MDAKEAVVLANQYGISTVVCFVIIGIFVWVLRWVFRTSQAREESMAQIINTGLKGLTESLSEVARALNVNSAAINSLHAEFKEASRFQRIEHEQIKNDLQHGFGTIQAVMKLSEKE